jgi:hypothetical protein
MRRGETLLLVVAGYVSLLSGCGGNNPSQTVDAAQADSRSTDVTTADASTPTDASPDALATDAPSLDAALPDGSTDGPVADTLPQTDAANSDAPAADMTTADTVPTADQHADTVPTPDSEQPDTLFQCPPPAAGVFYVDVNTGSDTMTSTQGNGSQLCPFKTITHAISRLPPITATIYVAAGAYSDSTGETLPIYLPAGLSIIGSTSAAFPAGPTVQSGATFASSVFGSYGANTSLTDLSISVQNITGGQAWSVYVGAGGNLTLTDCSLSNSAWGALEVNGGSAQIYGTTLNANQMGMAVDGASTVTIGKDTAGNPTHFDHNKQTSIFVRGGTVSASTGTTIDSNNLGVEFGAVPGPQLNLTGCDVSNNTGSYSGIDMTSDGTVNATSTNFDNNGAGGIELGSTGDVIHVTSCEFSGTGAGIDDERNCASGCGWSTVQGSLFQSIAAGYGGVELWYNSTDGAHHMDLGGGGGGSTGGNQFNSPGANKNWVGVDLIGVIGSPSEVVSAQNDAWSTCPPVASTTTCANVDICTAGGPPTVSAATGCTVGK